jgi:hypothetical protein
VGGSLLGKDPDIVRQWANWYLGVREVDRIPVDEFLELAHRQDGVNPGVTKTKLRKAVARLLNEQRS